MLRTLPRFDFRVLYSGLSDLGRIRTNNEDVFRVEPSVGLFIVCDGMGGHDDGEVAAAMASEAFAQHLSSRQARRALDAFAAAPTAENRALIRKTLLDAGLAANSAVYEHAMRREPPATMGCTLDAALLLGDQAFVAHMGDSRVYLARGPVLSQITHDHSLFHSMLAAGSISPAAPQPIPDPLVNAVGLAPDPLVEISVVDLARGDRLLLCTDGVYGAFRSSAELGKLLRSGSVDEAARALIDGANDAGGRDNATVILIELAERFVARPASDDSARAVDLASLRASALLNRLPTGLVQRFVAAGAEVFFEEGKPMPRLYACSMVSYVILEGQVKFADNRAFGPPALLYPESLAGGLRDGAVAVAERPVRALRWRSDDFRDLCASDPPTAAIFYERLARLLAR